MMNKASVIATIGYERATVDEVIDKLQGAEIDTLVDVRAVASSRKAGFSKNVLSASLKRSGINYVHLRGLGTPKEGREAARKGRIGEMAVIYTTHLRSEVAREAMAEAVELAGVKRIALLCYEEDAADCHRRIVAGILHQTTGAEILHL
ncbi:MAG: DUF488 domain-containing protein [Rhodobacteraceae bacterium]|nr:DUF488 domain-containing protein [Paracoccaceae bacterium]